jgi:hypothetical protein
MIYELDGSLKPIDLPLEKPSWETEEPRDRFINSLTDRKTNWRTNEVTQTLFPHADNVPGPLYHKNYLEYLEWCYSRHYGIVLQPDHIWYTLLSELTLIIAEDPERFRDLFTTSDKKVEIVVETGAESHLPLDLVLDRLRELVPAGFVDDFIPPGLFSTTTGDSLLAFEAAFADAVSPYYSYSTYCCGIPRIRVEGTKHDWETIREKWSTIAAKLDCHAEYFGSVRNILSDIVGQFYEDDHDFWRNMFFAERCGSGSETEVGGWFTSLFREQPGGVRKSCNFSTHIAKVKYKHLNTGARFQLMTGVFSSEVEDGYLVPAFGHIVYRDTNPE